MPVPDTGLLVDDDDDVVVVGAACKRRDISLLLELLMFSVNSDCCLSGR